ncbi:MAG: DUF2341 domain-containing protein, partial [Myxococcota bacterium]
RDFPVLVQLDPGLIDYERANADGGDLRFYDPDGSPLAFEIERWQPGMDSQIWVRVPQIDGGSTDDHIVMQYGNSDALGGQDPAQTWAESYRGVWHLSDTLSDSTANGNDGSDGGATPVAGYIGLGRLFNCIDSYIDVGSDVSLDNLEQATYTMWLRLDGSGRQVALSKNGNSREMWIQGTEPTMMRARSCVQYTGDDDACPGSSNGAVQLGQWRLWTFTFDGAQDMGRLYLDGVFQSANAGVGRRLDDSDGDLNLGRRSESQNHYLNGILDEVRIAAEVRPEAWIRAQYLVMSNRFITYGPEDDIVCVPSS